MASYEQKRRRTIRSRLLGVLVILLIAGIIYLGFHITETYEERPDFGGAVTLRQADVGLDFDSRSVRLTRDMILSFVTDKAVLVPAARSCGWGDVPYETMVQAVEVREKLSTLRSFVIVVNSMNPERSQQIAQALGIAFLNHYQKEWAARIRENVSVYRQNIAIFEEELAELKETRKVFQENKELHPINSVAEMTAINDQLLEAQKQFLAAYGAYITRLESKRSEMQFQYNLARQVYTENDSRLKVMKLQLAEAERQCAASLEKLAKNKPDLYKLSLKPKPLTGFPNDILYYYENIQTLQRIKLAMMLDSLIEEKETMLEKERRKKDTVEGMLEANSCDVFIREGER